MSSPSNRPAHSSLHLGSGKKYMPGAVNVDLVAETGPDVVHNLNRIPWPFPDNSFDQVHAYDVVEHLDDVIATVQEIHRVCRPGAVVHITVPHFSCANAFRDPTHQHYFSALSFHYFTGENQFAFYTSVKYRRRRNTIVFSPSLVNKVMTRLANRYPERYERRWAWMFPAWFLYFELEVIKDL